MSTVEDSPGLSTARPEVVPLRRNRDFMLLWTGAGFTTLGAMLTSIIYPLLVLWQTGSAASTGLVSAAAALPHLVAQLPAGAIVDRFDRRGLMIFSDIGCVIICASVLVAVAAERIWLPHLIVAAFLQGSLSVFYELAEKTAVRHVVPQSQLATALGQNEARTQGVSMLANPLGSVLFSLLRVAPFLLTVVCHVLSLIQLLLIRKPFQGEREERTGGFWRDIVEGVTWLWARPFLRTVVILVSLSNMVFMAAMVTMLVLVHGTGSSPAGVGVIMAVAGVGGVAGAMTATRWRRILSMRAMIPLGLAAWTACIIPFAFVSDPWLLGLLFAANGYVSGVFNVTGSVYMMQVTPDEVFGRATSVMMTLGSGANFLGSLLGGAALDMWGVSTTVTGMSALMGALVIVGLISPAVRQVINTPEGGRLPAGS